MAEIPFTFAPLGGQQVPAGNLDANFAYLLNLVLSSGSIQNNITGSGVLPIGSFNAIGSAGGAFTGTLPALSGVQPGQFIELYDGDWNLSVHNYTLAVVGSDTLQYSGFSGTQFVMNQNDQRIRVVARTGHWQVIDR